MSEHIFIPLAGSTAVRCSCGKEYGAQEEAQQHQWWELQLEIANRIKEKAENDRPPPPRV